MLYSNKEGLDVDDLQWRVIVIIKKESVFQIFILISNFVNISTTIDFLKRYSDTKIIKFIELSIESLKGISFYLKEENLSYLKEGN